MATEQQTSMKTPHKKSLQYSTCPVTGMKFIQVPGGVFQMGNVFASENHEDDYFIDDPVHSEEVDDFYMAKYQVTQAEWLKIMDNQG